MIRTSRISHSKFLQLTFPLLFALALFNSQDAFSRDLIRSGSFKGANGHVTTGTVRIEQSGEKTFVVLGGDFSLDGAPAPTIGFSKSGKFDKSSEFTKLKANSGKQTYQLPATIDAAAYDRIHIWCADFSVSLGSAKLN